MSFTRFWYEALPFNISYWNDKLSAYSQHRSCLRYFPCCVGRGLYFFASQRQGCWEGNSRVSVLHFPYTISTVAVICLSFLDVVRDYWRRKRGGGEGEMEEWTEKEERRAGARCKANLIKALAPNFTSSHADKHSVIVLWSTMLPLQSEDLAWKKYLLPAYLFGHNFNPCFSYWHVRTLAKMCWSCFPWALWLRSLASPQCTARQSQQHQGKKCCRVHCFLAAAHWLSAIAKGDFSTALPSVLF